MGWPFCNKMKAKFLNLTQYSLYHIQVVTDYRLIVCYTSWKQHTGKLFQISPYCYFFLSQQDIKFPPSESSNRETRWPELLWQRSKRSDFCVCTRSIYIDSASLPLLTLLSNIQTGQKRNLSACINLLTNWGLEWSKRFKKWSASSAMFFFCLFAFLLLYWIRCSNPNRIPKKELSICSATFLSNTHF